MLIDALLSYGLEANVDHFEWKLAIEIYMKDNAIVIESYKKAIEVWELFKKTTNTELLKDAEMYIEKTRDKETDLDMFIIDISFENKLQKDFFDGYASKLIFDTFFQHDSKDHVDIYYNNDSAYITGEFYQADFKIATNNPKEENITKTLKTMDRNQFIYVDVPSGYSNSKVEVITYRGEVLNE